MVRVKIIALIGLFFCVCSVDASELKRIPGLEDEPCVEDPEEVLRLSVLEKENDIADRIISGDVALLDRPLDYLSLASLSKPDLRMLRNTIFAKNGYIFSSPDLKAHFTQYRWYRENARETVLSEIDKRNVDLIKKFEDVDTYSPEIQPSDSFYGWWHDINAMPSGYSRRFIFSRDRRFIFKYSDMRSLPEISSFSGVYELHKKYIRLIVEQTTLISHSNEYFCGHSGYTWKTRIKQKIIHERPITYIFPIHEITAADSRSDVLFKMDIGQHTFYKMEVSEKMTDE